MPFEWSSCFLEVSTLPVGAFVVLGDCYGVFLGCISAVAVPIFRWAISFVMTWILKSVEPHLVLNLRAYKTTAAMWNYLNTIYNQDNSARHFQLEYEMTNFTQGGLSIEEYFSGFRTRWTDYSDIVYANVPIAALFTVQAVHATSKRDQFLMKL
ncbi:hypothetical protein CK203_053058 [Vitis vinifera]|uniref:Retrotransposon gag domain-containing protein n=1 Tax=Vitis vinifera TaxID=29760 RepID=A0A438FL25_VITVI|nr:hypothetical protein CK203_053058 [Vitis vinifera]